MQASDLQPGAASSVAARHQGLVLLVVFGSRARGEARADSDWDFGYLGLDSVDPDRLLADLVIALRTDRIDLVDLARASGLLRIRAAREGSPVFQARADAWTRFCAEAASFWCDVEPVVRRAYEDVLSSIRP